MVQFTSLDYLTIILLILTTLLLIFTIISMFTQKRISKTVIGPKIIVKIKCLNNDYNEEKEFNKGYYVGLETGKCPKCGSKLVVDAIYSVGGTKEKELR
ncbi:MAG: hypothetical protein LM560_00175 [Desulfurococcaceae archaeon]|jgi:hypothetical protein|nr:hypothetical protein [Desulfurococcaceae archaeon]